MSVRHAYTQDCCLAFLSLAQPRKPPLGIVKLTDFMEISLITMPAKLPILGPGKNRFRLENEQILVNLTVPEKQLDILRSYDDRSSVVTLYLAAESEYLGRDSVGLLPGLQAAMNSGYALAIFWYAIRLRDALTSGVVVPGGPRFVQYCETMHLAYEQGLADVARRYLESECSFVQ